MTTRKALIRRIKERLKVQDDQLLRDVEEFLRATMTVLEAGKLGGDKVKRTHGVTFYSEIGSVGGAETKRRHGIDHYQRIGALGGRSRKTND